MNPVFVLRNGQIVNEGKIVQSDLLIRNGRIEKIAPQLSVDGAFQELDCSGCFVLPGIIDDQVHFREPGLTHKGNLFSESKAALAGGVTSFMEMPNTQPTTTTAQALDDKLALARNRCWSNYAFFFGATNENLEDVLRVDPHKTCGIKIFMGSSTGNMLVDQPQVLEKIFSSTPLVVATHCEDEATIRQNMAQAEASYGTQIPFALHPEIRSREACIASSSLAVRLAKKYGTNLHILHLTTEEELDLFSTGDMKPKHITSEVCVHHLWFDESSYPKLGGLIKCNPAIKKASDKHALLEALKSGRIDIIATDHAPHTWEEKSKAYKECPSGLPLVQHGLNLMYQFVRQGLLSLELLVEKMCHNPATRFSIQDRGFIREGYMADLVVFNPNESINVSKENILYHCGWSPFEGETFFGKNICTFVNGQMAFLNDQFLGEPKGQPLAFYR